MNDQNTEIAVRKRTKGVVAQRQVIYGQENHTKELVHVDFRFSVRLFVVQVCLPFPTRYPP